MSTHNIHFQNKTIPLELSQIYYYQEFWEKNLGTQERIRNSRGKRDIGVRAIEVLLYAYFSFRVNKRSNILILMQK